MPCQQCKSERIADVCGKTSDLCNISLGVRHHEGYVPKDMGIGDKWGDYLVFSYCLDCGQIQGEFPLPTCRLEKGDDERSDEDE